MTLIREFMTKRYVKVIVKYESDGTKRPLKIYFDDCCYEIDRIINVKNCASLKVGGIGERYTIEINNKQTFLFFEKDKWFVEAKK